MQNRIPRPLQGVCQCQTRGISVDPDLSDLLARPDSSQSQACAVWGSASGELLIDKVQQRDWEEVPHRMAIGMIP